MNEEEEKRAELNNIQREIVALLADVSELETRLEKLRANATELYEVTDSKLDEGI